MKKTKSTSFYFLAVLLVTLFFIGIPGNVQAETFEDYEYKLINSDTEVEISDYNGAGGDIVIPSEIEGKSVTSIGDYAFYSNQLTSVIIPEGVTSIGSSAFDSNQLTSVSISEGLTSIGDFAFNSNQLTSVAIPEGVTSIGLAAFYSNQLTSVTIPKTVTSIGGNAFGGNTETAEDFTIYGEVGSRAESYATEYEHNFIPIGIIDVENITVNGADDKTIIETSGGTLQMIANLQPENASNKNVEWSVESITGEAEIDDTGLLKALKNGLVKVTATSLDGTNIQSNIDITITNQLEWQIWEAKHDVLIDKSWTVEFNRTIDSGSIKEENIYITDENNDIIPMTYYQEEANTDKYIEIIPTTDYQSKHTYTLWIKDLKAGDGSVLSSNVKMDFTIK